MTEAAPKSVVTKILSIFWEPSATFTDLKQLVKWFDIVIPLILIVIAVYIATPFSAPIAIKESKERIEKSERIPEDQKEQIIERIEARYNSTRNKIMRFLGAPLFKLIQYAVIALVMLFISNVLLGGENKYVPLLAMSAYCGLVDIIATAVKVPLMVYKNSVHVYTGLGALMEVSQTFLFRFFAAIDIFALWKVVLLAIGLSVFNNSKTSKTIWPVLGVWIIFVLLSAALGGLIRI